MFELKNILEIIYEGFPSSFIIIKFIYKHIALFLNDFPSKISEFLLMDSLFCLFLSEKIEYKHFKDFQQLKKRNPILLAEFDFCAKTFLSFCKLFSENILKKENNIIKELFLSFEMKCFQNFLDIVNLFDDSHILTFPLKVLTVL